VHCKGIRERFLKNDKLNPVYCIVASASNKSTYMYSDWLNNFWIVQSHLLFSPHSTISVNNKPIQKMMSQFVYTHTTPGQGGLQNSGVLVFQQLGPSCIYSQSNNNNCPSRRIHTIAENRGELPERKILLREMYGCWANVGKHHGGKCHNTRDISTHRHAMYRFIFLYYAII
jgi:hypothetical protein